MALGCFCPYHLILILKKLEAIFLGKKFQKMHFSALLRPPAVSMVTTCMNCLHNLFSEDTLPVNTSTKFFRLNLKNLEHFE